MAHSWTMYLSGAGCASDFREEPGEVRAGQGFSDVRVCARSQATAFCTFAIAPRHDNDPRGEAACSELCDQVRAANPGKMQIEKQQDRRDLERGPEKGFARGKGPRIVAQRPGSPRQCPPHGVIIVDNRDKSSIATHGPNRRMRGRCPIDAQWAYITVRRSGG